jgi:hypothetical protein
MSRAEVIEAARAIRSIQVDDLLRRILPLLSDEDQMHPVGCATWSQAAFVVADEITAFLGDRVTPSPAEASQVNALMSPRRTLEKRWAWYRSEAENAPTPTMRAMSGGAADALLGLFPVFGYPIPSREAPQEEIPS